MMGVFIPQIIPPDLATEISSNLGTSLVVLGLYTLGFIGTAYFARSQYEAGLTDYIVASRSLGWIVVTLTIVATAISGAGVAGFPGFVYLFGASFVVAGMTGFAAAAVLTWYVGSRIWELGRIHDFKTPGDLLGRYYRSDLVRVYTVIASIIYNIAYLVAQLIAGGILVNVLTGGIVSFEIGILIIGLIILGHVSFTGIRGIAYLDTFNGALITLIFVIFAGFVVAAAAGLANVFNSLPAELFAGYTAMPDVTGTFTPDVAVLWGAIFLIGIWLMSPAVWIRFYSFDKRVNITRIAASILLIGAVIFIIGHYLIGVWGRVVLSDIGNPDFVSSVLAFDVMPFALGALFLMAVLAAVISTGDSYLHALAATFSRDFVKAIVKEDMSESTEMRVNYGVMFIAVLISLVFAIAQPGLIVPITVFAAAFTIMLFPPLLGAIAWPRASTEAAIIAPAVGSILVLVYQFTDILPNPYPVPSIPGLVVSFAVCVILFAGISYLTKPVPMEQIEEFHGNLR